MKNLPGEVADEGEVEGDGHALLAVEDPVCCSRRRQDFCRERGFPNVAFMEDERSTVQLACAICCCCTVMLGTVRLRSTCCCWSRRDIDKERVLAGIGLD
ncbi:hypothetical protein Peur_058160 [Populus x canadensis]